MVDPGGVTSGETEIAEIAAWTEPDWTGAGSGSSATSATEPEATVEDSEPSGDSWPRSAKPRPEARNTATATLYTSVGTCTQARPT